MNNFIAYWGAAYIRGVRVNVDPVHISRGVVDGIITSKWGISMYDIGLVCPEYIMMGFEKNKHEDTFDDRYTKIHRPLARPATPLYRGVI